MEKKAIRGPFCIVPRFLIERLSSHGLGASHLGLLVFLIDKADRTGMSFWSLKKIAAAFGCSKSTVSRMLSDLAKVNLITKSPRPRRDRANSVLEVTIVGFAAFREDAPQDAEQEGAVKPENNQQETAQPVEPVREHTNHFSNLVVAEMKRAVASTERHGNNIQGKQNTTTTVASPVKESGKIWTSELEQEWVSLFGHKTDLHFQPSRKPSEELLKAAIRHADSLKERKTGSESDGAAAWSQMLQSLRISATAQEIDSLAKTTAKLCGDELRDFLKSYTAFWKPFWKRPPLPDQVSKMVKEFLAVRPRGQAHNDNIRASECLMRSMVAGRLLQAAERSRLRRMELA